MSPSFISSIWSVIFILSIIEAYFNRNFFGELLFIKDPIYKLSDTYFLYLKLDDICYILSKLDEKLSSLFLFVLNGDECEE
jgi:hypothetical protein